MNPSEKIKTWAQQTKQFYLDVRGEMRKVSWPSRQEVMGTTVVVVVAVFFLWFVSGLGGLPVGHGPGQGLSVFHKNRRVTHWLR